MVFEIQRRRLLRSINSKYIYGRVVSFPHRPAMLAFCRKLWTAEDSRINTNVDFSTQTARCTSSNIPHRDGNCFAAGSQVQQLLYRTSKYVAFRTSYSSRTLTALQFSR